MNKFRRTLELSLSLASAGKIEDALSKLEEGIRDASEAQDYRWHLHLSRNAGLLCQQKGDLHRAAYFYQLSLAHDGANPYTHFSLAEVYERLNKHELSSRHLDTCYQLALQSNETDILKILSERGYKGIS